MLAPGQINNMAGSLFTSFTKGTHQKQNKNIVTQISET